MSCLWYHQLECGGEREILRNMTATNRFTLTSINHQGMPHVHFLCVEVMRHQNIARAQSSFSTERSMFHWHLCPYTSLHVDQCPLSLYGFKRSFYNQDGRNHVDPSCLIVISREDATLTHKNRIEAERGFSDRHRVNSAYPLHRHSEKTCRHLQRRCLECSSVDYPIEFSVLVIRDTNV